MVKIQGNVSPKINFFHAFSLSYNIDLYDTCMVNILPNLHKKNLDDINPRLQWLNKKSHIS